MVLWGRAEQLCRVSTSSFSSSSSFRPLAELVSLKSQPCASNYVGAESWRAGTSSQPARPSPRRYHAGVPCLVTVSMPSIELFSSSFSTSSSPSSSSLSSPATRWGSAVARAAASPRCHWPSSTWWTCLKVSLSPVSSSLACCSALLPYKILHLSSTKSQVILKRNFIKKNKTKTKLQINFRNCMLQEYSGK